MATCFYQQCDIVLEEEAGKTVEDGIKKEEIKELYTKHSIFDKAAQHVKSNDCNLSENASNLLKLK